MTRLAALVAGLIFCTAPLLHVGSALATASSPAPTQRIRHIVILLRENHTYDNVFGRFSGGDGTTRGKLPNGRFVPLQRTPDPIAIGLGHTGNSARVAVNGGRMNGFSKLQNSVQDGRRVSLSQYRPSDIPNFWSYARHFTLDDHFFSTVAGPSFPNHLALVAGSSDGVVDDPVANAHRDWGCTA